MEKITRKAAHDSAMLHYFTGVACIHGHIAPRLVTTGNCVECNRTMRPHRRINPAAHGYDDLTIVAVTLRVPRQHVEALREMARAMCALEYPPAP